MWASLFKFLADLVAAIPIFDRWFTKTPSEKKQEAVENVRDRHDKFRKGPQE